LNFRALPHGQGSLRRDARARLELVVEGRAELARARSMRDSATRSASSQRPGVRVDVLEQLARLCSQRGIARALEQLARHRASAFTVADCASSQAAFSATTFRRSDSA
jgi:hypothetical protein